MKWDKLTELKTAITKEWSDYQRQIESNLSIDLQRRYESEYPDAVLELQLEWTSVTVLESTATAIKEGKTFEFFNHKEDFSELYSEICISNTVKLKFNQDISVGASV